MTIHLQFICVEPELLVINKPAGLLSIPDGYDPDLPNLKSILSEAFGPIWVVHRLDKDTSGIMIFARNAATHRDISLQFEQRMVEKHYHAIICGVPPWSHLSIRYPLRTNADRRHRTRVHLLTGKPAKTNCHLKTKSSTSSLVDIIPGSGYTHQIRSHLSTVGYPILADPLYSSSHESTVAPLTIQRPALHAFTISLMIHDMKREYSAPYPEDFLNELVAQNINEGLTGT